MSKIILIIKGMLLGIANIIPGVSGATVALSLGIYEHIIKVIKNIKNNLKENIRFLVLLIIGIGLGIVLFSDIILYLIEKHPLFIFCFFIGLIAGSTINIFKQTKINTKNIIIFLFFLILVYSSSILLTGEKEIIFNMTLNSLIPLFGVGIISASAMVIPGISGSLLLMTLGFYKPIINSISEFTKFNNFINNTIYLGVFGVGVLIGIVIMINIINHFLQTNKEASYAAILGIIMASIFILIRQIYNIETVFIKAVLALLMFDTAFILSYFLSTKE